MSAWEPMDSETPPFSPCSAAAEEGAGEAVLDAAPGDGILAVFPRMAGKNRPGVVVHQLQEGVVALPLTTRRTNQPGRLPMPDAELVSLGFEKRSHLLLPRAAYLPFARLQERRGAVSNALLAQILGEMVEWYELDWRERDPALRAPGGQARLLHPRRRNASG